MYQVIERARKYQNLCREKSIADLVQVGILFLKIGNLNEMESQLRNNKSTSSFKDKNNN